MVGDAVLGEEGGDEFAVDVREVDVAAAEAIGELGGVEAEEVEKGGVEVVDGGDVFDGVVA